MKAQLQKKISEIDNLFEDSNLARILSKFSQNKEENDNPREVQKIEIKPDTP